jgi:asparagine synthase (glutamine-hydrolysing)
LRTACEDLLPPEIVWRDKEQFDEGSGTAELASRRGFLGDWLAESESKQYARRYAQAALRSPEECAYHKILGEAYAEAGFVFQNVARWSSGRLGAASAERRPQGRVSC